MKKWIVCISVLMLSNVMTFAKKEFSFTEGKAKNLQKLFSQKNQQMLVEFDYSTTMWEDDGPYKEFCGNDYEKRVADSYVAFVEAFNKKNKKMQATTDKTAEVKAKLVVKINELERKDGSSAWGRMYIRMYGTLTVFDVATGKPVITAEIYKLPGDEDYVEDDRLKKCFAALAEELRLHGGLK